MGSLEKRKFDRLKIDNFKLKYRLENVDMTPPNVDVLNISAGGVCFLRDSVMYKGDTVEVLFPFKSRNIILKATVIRVEGREVAVKFIDQDIKIDEFVDLFNSEYKIIREETAKKNVEKESLFSGPTQLTYSSLKEKLNDDKMFDPDID